MDDRVDVARRLRLSGVEMNDVLIELRSRGASIVDCVKIVRAVERVDLGRAKVIVDDSPAWADVRSANNSLRQDAVEAFERGEA